MLEKRSVNYLPQLDGLRFIAVLGVMIEHWWNPMLSQSKILGRIPYGSGVNLFFVISGFLITFILLNRKDEIQSGNTTFWREIKNFFAKRTLRIFPIYYLVIAILCVLSFSTIKNYLVHLLTYTINWHIVFENTYISDKTHLWSLAVEEQFYLVWPFLIFLVPRNKVMLVIIGSILISFLTKIFFFNSEYIIGVNAATPSCFDSLGLGAFAAYLQKNRTSAFNPFPFRIGLLITGLGYITVFMVADALNPALHSLLINTATSCVYFFLVVLAANNSFTGTFRAFLESPAILYLGRISYGLYLYHPFMTAIFFKSDLFTFFPGWGEGDLYILYFAITVSLASISWYLIERPLLNLKRYFQ